MTDDAVCEVLVIGEDREGMFRLYGIGNNKPHIDDAFDELAEWTRDYPTPAGINGIVGVFASKADAMVAIERIKGASLND